MAAGQTVLDQLRSLIVSYLGLLIQTPDMFPRHAKPSGETISALCLLPSLIHSTPSPAMGTFGSSDSSSAGSSSLSGKNDWARVEPHETAFLLSDLADRFSENDNYDELQDILGPAFMEISRRILEGEEGNGSSASMSSSATTRRCRFATPTSCFLST